MANPGDIVLVDFVGVRGVKRPPAVVVSSDTYHHWRPDTIVGLVTGQVTKATAPTDYSFRDWQAAGLVKPSAFRSYFNTLPRKAIITVIGQVTDHDWQGIVACIRTSMG